ncbi:class A sortase [Salisediminibacterium selenitireducens]|uniref:Sortase family protein n=1 Tax=Bacillus selenitireducens (strain ATCC 700615 / DSM 15326 / MLS10) TaxID=439292 RepID=D6XZN2_BACIE|nr:class A sortase [Salisediminibacterium selenitireducens]ADH98406.1 sortase family protein [[Bacillus] selenitireducens MLS10]
MNYRIIMASLFILTGLTFLFWQPAMNHVIGPVIMKQAHEELFGLTHEDYRNNRETVALQEDLFDYDSVDSLNALSVFIDLNHEHAIGEIMIPSVDVHLPVLLGTNHEVLKAGIGTMKPDQQMGEGNYALAGHNSRNPNQLFAPIRYMEIGDEIHVTDKDMIYVYRMISREIVDPDRIDVIEDVDGVVMVTLVSCYSADGSDRIIIQGELAETISYASVSRNKEK